MPEATLADFARVNDAAAATTKKLLKQAILAEYFRSIADDDDLRRAVRFAAGRTFAATDERVLAVGWAIVTDVVLPILKIDPKEYHDLVVKSGEIGEALARVWPTTDSATQASQLQFSDLAIAFEDLAATGNVQNKRSILRELFERCATGREAAYVAKIISGDLRTGVQEGVLHAAIAEAFGRDAKTVQRCQLLVGDLGEVAVMARQDACATAQFRLFHPIQFMLATPQETSADAADTMSGRTFSAEDKLDGIRAQVHKDASGRVAIYTRTMDRTDESFPDVVAAIAKLPGEFLLDGEIVPSRDGCVLPFAHIQRRLGRKLFTPKILRENPATFIAFDILYRDGELLMDRPLRERREHLDRLAEHTALLVTRVEPVQSSTDIDRVFADARARRNEGIVLKDLDSPYSPGRRGQMWLKIKTHLPTLDCVVTAAEYGHGKRRNTLSDYTFAVWDREPVDDGAQLVNVGKAYSGVTDEEIAQLTELFLKLAKTQHGGRVYVVEPKIVMEIACDQIQKSNRHASGYALRFPRIKRIRWDKRPEDADRLSRVAEIYESETNFARRRHEANAEAAPVPEPTLFDGM